MRKLRLLLPVLLIPVLILAGCGDGGNDEEDKVVETIEAASLSTDADDCTKLFTVPFLEQVHFRKGQPKIALSNCVYYAKRPKLDLNDVESVAVSNVEIEGSEATADVAFTGGTFDDQTLSVVVIEEDGSWKMDELTGFVEFDQDKLAEFFEAQLAVELELEPKVVSCVGEELRKLPQAEFEKVMIEGDTEPIVVIVQGCQE